MARLLLPYSEVRAASAPGIVSSCKSLIEWGRIMHAQGLIFCRCYCFVFLLFFITVPLETSYLRMLWTDLHQIFRICSHILGHDPFNLPFATARDFTMETDFGDELPPMFDKSLANFVPVTAEFCRRVCGGRATCCGLQHTFAIWR